MGIHIEERLNRGPRFCPIIKEMCIKGWTRGMGEDEKTGERPVCAAWQPVSAHIKGEIKEIYDCNLCGWPADLLTEVAKEVFETAATTDLLRKETRKNKIDLFRIFKVVTKQIGMRFGSRPLMDHK